MRRRPAVAALLAPLVLGLAACGNNDTPEHSRPCQSDPKPGFAPALVALVLASIAARLWSLPRTSRATTATSSRRPE